MGLPHSPPLLNPVTQTMRKYTGLPMLMMMMMMMTMRRSRLFHNLSFSPFHPVPQLQYLAPVSDNDDDNDDDDEKATS